MYYVKKKDNVVKFDKTIEAVLALLLIYQSVLYLIISFEFVDPWVFPTSVLFLGSCGLGAVFGVFGGFGIRLQNLGYKIQEYMQNMLNKSWDHIPMAP
jgi:hypothetical protein